MLAAAGPRKPSLAAFCPPKCPPSDLLSSGPTEQDSVTARKFDIRALHATQYNREPSRSVTTVWSACQAATPVSAAPPPAHRVALGRHPDADIGRLAEPGTAPTRSNTRGWLTSRYGAVDSG